MVGEKLAICGGKLIDGLGGPPVEDLIIVINGGRFEFVGRRDGAQIPPDAEVIDASGRTILPGFIDGHGHLEDFHGELYLHLGITSCVTIEIFQDGPWTVAQREGTRLGKIRGPRIWTSGRAIGGGRTETEGGGSRAIRGNITVTTPEEARDAVRRKKDHGLDVIKLNEFISYDLAKAVVDEAHRWNMPVTAHSWDVIELVKAGVDGIEHIWSVGFSSILDVKRRRELAKQRLSGNIEHELSGAFYEPENYGDIIEAMVKRGVAWTPTIAKWLCPLSPNATRFRERESQILNDPGANLPAAAHTRIQQLYDKILNRYSPSQLDRVKIFYDKANEFIRRFVEAGGLLKEGSDPSPNGLAAIMMHEALAMDVEAGVPPMKAIQAATINVAKAFRKDKDYGSVEPGKVADLSIIEGDPLADIWMTQNVKMVIMDGKVMDIGFHGYKNPIPCFYSHLSLPMDLDLSPARIAAGSGPTTLRVKGRGIWPFHQVMLNGVELPTRYVDKTTLEATIPPSAVAEAGTYIVTVKAQGEPVPESRRAHLTVSF